MVTLSATSQVYTLAPPPRFRPVGLPAAPGLAQAPDPSERVTLSAPVQAAPEVIGAPAPPTPRARTLPPVVSPPSTLLMEAPALAPVATTAAPTLGSPPKPPSAPVKNAVIIGGGPGGLATAIEMAKKGIKVTVLEVRDENYARPHHLNARQGTIDMLAEYGVEKEVRADSGFDPTRALPGDVSRLDSDPQSLLKSPSVGEIRISDIEKALYAKARELGVEYLHHTTSVLSPPETDGPHKGLCHLQTMHAEQADGKFSPDGPATDRGYPDMVVVADGANSPTRRGLGIDFVPTSEPRSYLGAIVNKPFGDKASKIAVMQNGYPTHIMVTGHAKYPQAWVSAEVDADHANMSPEERVDYLAHEASVVMKQDIKPEDLQWGKGQITSVQNRKATTTVAGENVILVGDAARTGSVWVSGGINLALTTDVSNVMKMVGAINEGGVDRATAMAEYNNRTQDATRCWHEAGAPELSRHPAAPTASVRL